MSSQNINNIDPTQPKDGSASTQGVRDNFANSQSALQDHSKAINDLTVAISGGPKTNAIIGGLNSVTGTGLIEVIDPKSGAVDLVPTTPLSKSFVAQTSQTNAQGSLDVGSAGLVADTLFATANHNHLSSPSDLPVFRGDQGFGGQPGVVPAPLSGDSARFLKGTAGFGGIIGVAASDININGLKLLNAKIFNASIKSAPSITSTGTVQVDFSVGRNTPILLIGNPIISFTNPPSSGFYESVYITFTQDGVGKHAPIWPSNVYWNGGTTPTIASVPGQITVVEIFTIDGGQKYFGRRVASNYAYVSSGNSSPSSYAQVDIYVSLLGAKVTASVNTLVGTTKKVTSSVDLVCGTLVRIATIDLIVGTPSLNLNNSASASLLTKVLAKKVTSSANILTQKSKNVQAIVDVVVNPNTTFNFDINFLANTSSLPGVATIKRASPATYTDSSGILRTAAVDTPRWEYSTSSSHTLLGLLVEPTAQNLMNDSNNFTTSFWFLNDITDTLNSQTGPDGVANSAQTFATTNGGTNIYALLQGFPNPVQNKDYTFSIFFKKIAGDKYLNLKLSVSGDSTQYRTVYDMNADNYLQPSDIVNVVDKGRSVQTYASGWRRYLHTETNLAATGGQLFAVWQDNDGSGSATAGSQWAPYGAQLIQETLPTSYIPPGNTNNIRSADVLTVATGVGHYDILVNGSGSCMWFLNQVADSNGNVTIQPPTGDRFVNRTRICAAGSLTKAQTDSFCTNYFSPPPPPPPAGALSYRLGAFVGDVNGESNLQAYETMLTRPSDFAFDYLNNSSEQELINSSNYVPTVYANGRNLILSVPLCWNSGSFSAMKQLLTDISNGVHDNTFNTVFSNLASFNSGRPILVIRIGWEMQATSYDSNNNVSGMPWGGDPTSYVAAFKKVSTISRQYLPNALIDWCPNAGADWTAYYPGDAYVDICGIDAYQSTSFNQTVDQQINGSFGVSPMYSFAQQHNKPLSIPEWASNYNDGQYIQAIHDFVGTRKVAYISYWDSNSSFNGYLPDLPVNESTYINNWKGTFYSPSGGTPTPSPPPPPPPPESADSTAVPPASQIVDANGTIWTISSGQQVVRNGAIDTSTSAVVLLVYYNHTVYQENSAGNWYLWNGSGFQFAAGDPRPASPPSTPTAPAGAQSAGYTYLAFNDDFNTNTIGTNWFLQRPFGWTDLPSQYATISNGVLSITGDGTGPNYSIATVKSNGSGGFTGFTVPPGKGAYLEARIKFNTSYRSNSNGWPSFWSMGAEHLYGGVSDEWMECDVFEDLAWQFNNPNAYVGTVHDHVGQNSDTQNTTNAVATGTADFNQFQTFGALWKPGGSVTFYFNDSASNISQSWTSGGTFSILDRQSWPLILGCGTNTTMGVDWVRVWTSPPPPPPPPLPTAMKIMTLGDSITAGQASTTGRGYRTELITKLITSGVSVTYVGSQTDGTYNHEGHSGVGIQGIVNGINNSNWLSVNPDVITLMIGTNDVSGFAWGGFGNQPSTSTLLNNLGSLIDLIFSKLPNVRLYVSNLLPRTGSNFVDVTPFNAGVPNVVAIRANGGKACFFLDAYTSFPSSTDLSDGLHPNDAGYLLLGDDWWNVVINSYSAASTTAAATVGSGTLNSPAIAPGPGSSTTNIGSGWTCVYNLTFGSGANTNVSGPTVRSRTDLLNYCYTYNPDKTQSPGGTTPTSLDGAYWSSTYIPPEAASAIDKPTFVNGSGQTVPIYHQYSATKPAHDFTASSMITYVRQIDDTVSTISPYSLYYGYFRPKAQFYNPVSSNGHDLYWEVRYRMVGPPSGSGHDYRYFWTALWITDFPYAGEFDALEAEGYDNTFGTNFAGHGYHSLWHTGATGQVQSFKNYNADGDAFNLSLFNYNTYGMLFKKDGTFAVFANDVQIQGGTYVPASWPNANTNPTLNLQHDGAWGGTHLGSWAIPNGGTGTFPVDHTYFPFSYEWTSSRVYLR